MTQFIIGTSVHVFNPPEGTLAGKLPAAVYTVQQDPMTGQFYLGYGVNLPTQLQRHYGDLEERADRIMGTYLKRGKSTGVALTGFKGTGKSLLAREVCRKALAVDIPVIMVNKGFGGEEFCTFIASIEQKAVILFEEFDKNYPERSTSDVEDEGSSNSPVNSLLSLLDGIYNSDKLYLFTSNSDLPYFLHNRPSRVYYHFEYGAAIAEDIVKDYCEDNLFEATVERVQDIVAMTNIAYEFSFDMLQAVVEEANRYPDLTIKELVKAINVDAQLADTYFTLTFFYKPVDGSEEVDISVLFGRPTENVLNGYNHSFFLTSDRAGFRPDIFRSFPQDVITRIEEALEGNDSYRMDTIIRKHLGSSDEYIRCMANSFKPIGKGIFAAHPTDRVRIVATPIKAVQYNRYAY